ncbi:MAG: DNA translocase FtsK [Christensenellales bacterium]
MTANAKGTTKVSLRSTDRGGVVSLSAGILCLALGFGMLIGITLQANSRSIVALKDLALGLGGVLYPLMPALAIGIGWLLCISARHYISYRAYLLVFLFVLSLCAFLTLVTSVAGFGTLMDYIRNMNANLLKVPEPESFGEYLNRSYSKFSNQLKPLPGGGAFGMLLAFPVWKLLGQVGGLIFLGLCLLGLALAFFRVNPAHLMARLDGRLQRPSPAESGESAQPGVAAPQQPQEAAMDSDGEEAEPQPPRREPYFVAPYQPPVYVAETAAYSQSLPPEEGFTAADQAYYEPFGQETARAASPCLEPREPEPAAPVPAMVSSRLRNPSPQTPAPQTVKAAASDTRPPWEEAPAAKPSPVAAAPAASLPSSPPPVTTQRRPSFTQEAEGEAPAAQTARTPQAEDSTAMVRPKTESEAEPQKKAQTPLHERPIRDVGVAPAVSLSGEKIAVDQKTSLAPEHSKLDGTPRTRPIQKQMSLPLENYDRPPARLLSLPPEDTRPDTTQEDMTRAEKLISTLTSFNISAQMQQIVHGPAITRFAIRLAEGVNVNKLRNVMDNIAVELLAKSPIRAEIPIPGTPLIGIEVSNDKATTVFLSEVLNSPKMQENKSPTAVALGKDITGAPVICELMDMPHLLIAGATGSGKSVCINSIITSLLYRASPQEVKLILVDPKFVELQPYNDVPHLLLPVVVDPKKAVAALEWVCQEMDERYQKLQTLGVRNIDAYNKKLAPDTEPMPKIIVIIDEMSDLMVSAGKIIDEHVKRITAKARAAGICLILATQRPSVDVITGIIKANIPSRIAFQVSSQIDSRTILDNMGAEKLLGYGDMLYLPRNLSSPKRVQGCFISDKDVGQVADYVKSRNQPEYNVDIMEHIEQGDRKDAGATAEDRGDEEADAFDDLLPKAIEMAVEAGQMSISMLQRVLRVGYGRAGRLIDEMARRNIISGNEGTKARKTLITREEYGMLFDDESRHFD